MLEITRKEYETLKFQGKENQIRRTKHKYYKITDIYAQSSNGKPRPRFYNED